MSYDDRPQVEVRRTLGSAQPVSPEINRRKPEIEIKLDSLANAIGILEEEVNILSARLQAVTSPRPKAENVKATAPSATAIGACIQGQMDRVFSLAGSISAMRESLEV